MMSGLVSVSFSLPEWQAVKMIFFAPCMGYAQYTVPDTEAVEPTFAVFL